MQSRPSVSILALLIAVGFCARIADAGVIHFGEDHAPDVLSIDAETFFSMAGNESNQPVFCEARGDDLGMSAIDFAGSSAIFPVFVATQQCRLSKPTCSGRLCLLERLQLPPPVPLSLLKVPIRRLA